MTWNDLAPATLMVHQYGFNRDGSLGPFTQTICDKIARIWENYRYIFLLGGWHDSFLPARPTGAEPLMKELVMRGVPFTRLYTQFMLDCERHMPPRCTIEEADLAARMIRNWFHKPPREVAFDAIGLWFHAPRIRLIYKTRNAPLRRVVMAFAPSSLWSPIRLAQEPVGYWLTKKDPAGIGSFFTKLRRGRTHQGSEQFNLGLFSSAWSE